MIQSSKPTGGTYICLTINNMSNILLCDHDIQTFHSWCIIYKVIPFCLKHFYQMKHVPDSKFGFYHLIYIKSEK